LAYNDLADFGADGFKLAGGQLESCFRLHAYILSHRVWKALLTAAMICSTM
jgi:hypothetical protein